MEKVVKGTDLARAVGGEAHADVIDHFKEQLLIVFLKRLVDKEGKFTVPISEVDDTGGDLLAFAVRDNAFHFELQKKN